MSAGAIKAPLIIPLRLPALGKSKNSIDNCTQIDISTDTPNCRIYFTIDGSRPNPSCFKSRRNPKASTYLFTTPFCLPVGIRTVKAIAELPSTKQDSNIVTKKFDVKIGDPGISSSEVIKPLTDDYGFLDELRSATKLHVQAANSENMLASKERPLENLTANGSVDTLPPPILKHSPTDDELSLIVEKSKRTNSVIDCNTPSVYENGDSKRLDSNKQFKRIYQELDPMSCPKCYAQRPPGTNSVFCIFCGTSLPELPKPAMSNPIPTARSLNNCPTCGTSCAMHEDFCLVCEAPLTHREHPLSKSVDVERRLCPTCGSLNPIALASCLTCEAALPRGVTGLVNIASLLPQRNPKQFARSAWPSQPETTMSNALLMSHLGDCRGCQNTVSQNMRFCQWCGIKDPFHLVSVNQKYQNYKFPQNDYEYSQHELEAVDGVCKQCLAENPPNSRFCCRCGGNILPSLHKSNASYRFASNNQQLTELNNDQMMSSSILWSDRRDESMKPQSRVTSAVSTQTNGLFFPSAIDLKKSGQDVQLCKDLERDYRSRATLLAPISPGKGFWRMQLEHIVVHLKAYTRNNPDFRKVLGIPRLGRLAAVGLDEEENNLIVTMTFQQHNREQACSTNRSNPSTEESSEDVDRRKQVTLNNSYNYRRHSYEDDVMISDEETVVETVVSSKIVSNDRRSNKIRRPKKSIRKEKVKTATSLNACIDDGVLGGLAQQRLAKLSKLDKALHYELRPGNNTNVDELVNLLSEGADPRSIGVNGDPALIAAVRHRHVEAIPALVTAGADVNDTGSRHKNTALHEAVLLGSAAKEYVQVLLTCGANANTKNSLDRSPHDLAVQEKLETVLEVFAIHLGQQELEKFTLEKSSNVTALPGNI